MEGTTLAPQKYLSIVSDDFGLYPPMNEGISRAFTHGVLTDTNLMSPCPGYDEAVVRGREIGIPIGLHATFSCETRGEQRWGPVSGLPSLRRDDGALPQHPQEFWANANEGEAAAEVRAQYEKLAADGIQMTHIRQHRGLDKDGRCARALGNLARETGVPYVQPEPSLPAGAPYLNWTTFFNLSDFTTSVEERKARLKEILHDLGPGHHLWTVHCSATPAPPADATAGGGQFDIWRTYCAIDHALVMDPEVREWIDGLGIQRVPMSRGPVAIAE